ncbi:ABC transporter related protein [Thermoproteus uzoniensis 768-20]|uniref:ABC transporter related protein n=1 Tax=Thermoproteus uzoniensis (strain 768-20) TaxID=999630 RepID=F2L0K0_THEU7|nr:ABC transporter ATP-binding protein [Thermoproteus uzoniensis]AEA12682.1 ABC transporter related protein [Thermoproteus uzoniensis 768-20]
MAPALLQASGLRKSFGGVKALDGVDIEVASGERVAVVGPNGSGKTTLINAITGFVKLDGGAIRLEGRDITRLPPEKRVKLGIARSFQLPSLFWGLTVYENALIASSAAGLRDGAREVLEEFGLWDKRHLRVEELSEGDKKLLDIALAMAARPKLLLLDEPTSSVAAEDKHRLMERLVDIIKSRTTVVFVEHDIEIVEAYATRVVVMAQGRVVATVKPEEVRAVSL